MRVCSKNVLGQITQGSQDLDSLIFLSLENEPARRLGKRKNSHKNNDSEDNLESERETPRDARGLEKGEAEVEPVRETDTAGDKSTFDHDHHS